MSLQLVPRRDSDEGAMLAVLKGLEIEKTLGAEPVLAALRRFPPEAPQFSEFPDDLHPKLKEVLAARGIERLYTHQRQAFDQTRAGRNSVVVTPTASGKTLCYNLPVLDRILKDPDARALYLFPTKALAQDQLAELYSLIEALGADIATFTYDGDTPQDARKAIRSRAHVVVSNPDMLHKGILPHHTKWVKLFENLRYVVIDELHTSRGVYGSHLANILRRLSRLCRFYGSDPQFLCSSATIGNPKELAEALTEREMTLLDQSGAGRGERYFAIYNPPVVNRQLGIRRSALNCARDIALSFLGKGLQTIVFAPSRLSTEVMVTYLKEALETRPGSEGVIRGYRGGYLPLKRREIERGLREGSVLGVVSTNALELGIDIGSLDVAILLGYPGSVASAWQQAGRAGRRQGTSVAVLVANSTPLNQFIAKNPDYFFGSPVEQARINPDNLQILVNHVKCAAFELPFSDDEVFGREDLGQILSFLEGERLLHRSGGRWHWTSESYPADAVSLRSVSSDNFLVQDITQEPRIIAEVDFDSAPSMVHEKAVYILEGRTYFVEKYDHKERRVHVREAEVDYYTDAITNTKVKILDRFQEEPVRNARRNHGEVHVTSQVVGFKKIKFYTNENVGSGELTMPENEMHTTAYWLTVPREVMASLPFSGEERRDGVVALSYSLGQLAALFLMCDRHDLGVALGDNGQGEARVERGFRRARGPASGGRDGGSGGAGKPPQLERGGGFTPPPPDDDYEPNVFVYDNYPGGIGLSEPLYRLHSRLLAESRRLIAACACRDGCPSCVGPVGEVGSRGKEVALALLDAIMVEPVFTGGKRRDLAR
ncbi:MAG TPA: DEAD/DEAH box helicase [Vicinamibacteria bacterium]|nr:DEAD/DEAH box helicase [Vicinamibacteria bacterium]